MCETQLHTSQSILWKLHETHRDLLGLEARVLREHISLELSAVEVVPVVGEAELHLRSGFEYRVG